MAITRVGTSRKYAAGWEKAFGGRKKTVSERSGTVVQKKQAAAPATKRTVSKKSAGKKAAQKSKSKSKSR